MKKIIFIILVCTCFLLNLYTQNIDYVTPIGKFVNKIGNITTTLEELEKKYGTADLLEIVDVDDLNIPNAAKDSLFYKYYFEDIGHFWFYFNGKSKIKYLAFWTLDELFIDTLDIPKEKKKIQEYFGKGNVDKENKIGYWGVAWSLFFYFENDTLVSIVWSFMT